ncbi:MAG: hypothetical protein ABI600_06925 [Luteolibacter sp.]
MNQLPEAASEIAGQTADAAKETVQRATLAARNVTGVLEDVAKDAANRVTDTAKDMYQSAALKAEDTLATSKEYVRQNPVPVVLGAIAFGAAIGYMLVMARRKPTFRERYVDGSLDSVREAVLAALAPFGQRLHEGYDSAQNGAAKAMDQVNRFNPGRTVDSLSGKIGRVGNNLKFW